MADNDEMYEIKLQILGRSRAAIAAENPNATPQELNEIVRQEWLLNPYIDFGETLCMVALNPPATGFDEQDMRRAVELRSRAEAATKSTPALTSVLLPTELYAWLCGRLVAFRWGVAHANVLAFLDAVKGATRHVGL
jgi:hypothetical protein